MLRALTAATAIGIVANGARLRTRAAGLRCLDAAADPATPVEVEEWRAITATGVQLQPDTVAAAVAWATREGLDAVDLVPADLPVARALELLRHLDTATYRSDPLAEGRTAGHAVVVRTEVAARAELPEGPLTPAGMIDLARQVKRFAPRTSDVAVAPAERAVDRTHDEELAVRRAVYDRYSTVNLTSIGSELALLATGVAAARLPGAAAVLAHHAQPAFVLRGNPAGLAPRDLAVETLGRLAREAGRFVGLLRAHAPEPLTLRLSEELRPLYAKELEQGTDRFFEPRVEACRWCGAGDLVERFTSPDLIQHKPGTFRLDECTGCGHVFQNPRLSIEGLDFYYRDFYDGFAGEEMEKIFASESSQYDGRVAMVARHTTTPARWLDVGSGHAHFCLVAREAFAQTSFEGLDQSSSIEDAARRGWIDRAHRGWFPELAAELADQFDVVSMHHYLEHTREPQEELDAAAQVVRPGGLLMVEVPDPECPSGRFLGRYWMPWLQPQHQQFLSIGRLEQALEERGFTVLERYRMPPMRGLDTAAAAWFAAGQVVPRQWMPWQPRPTLATRAARAAACTAAVPVALVAAGAAQLSGVLAGDEPGNAFRVLARYDG